MRAGAREESTRSGAGIARWIAAAAICLWAFLIAIYAILFALTGYPVATALRGALANGLPDGLLALAAFETSRRLAGPRVVAGSRLAAHAGRALLLVGLAFAAKTLLLWIDVTFLRGGDPFRLVPGVVAWQLFVSMLLYAAVSAGAHAWQIDRRLREEESRAARAEALRARAELTALRAQLNPHFVFNVLHSVLGMVRNDPALAESALERLGDLLRYALRVHRDGADLTTLRQEWEFMDTYLELERIRLGNRLRIERRADPAALDRDVPTFSLQPLAENAIRHGIAPRAAGGTLSIGASIEGDELRLVVENDVDGAAPAAPGGPGGSGLRVLRDRLGVLYRGGARMEAGPTRTGGWRVTLAIPASPDDPEGGT